MMSNPPAGAIAGAVMKVLHGVRLRQADGQSYGEDTRLADAGFTSMDMVKVMLGVESAFDLMIPQELITPENFRDARAIAVMLAKLLAAGSGRSAANS